MDEGGWTIDDWEKLPKLTQAGDPPSPRLRRAGRFLDAYCAESEKNADDAEKKLDTDFTDLRRFFRQDDRIILVTEILVSLVYSAMVFLDASICENQPPSFTGSFCNAPFVKLTKKASAIYN